MMQCSSESDPSRSDSDTTSSDSDTKLSREDRDEEKEKKTGRNVRQKLVLRHFIPAQHPPEASGPLPPGAATARLFR